MEAPDFIPLAGPQPKASAPTSAPDFIPLGNEPAIKPQESKPAGGSFLDRSVEAVKGAAKATFSHPGDAAIGAVKAIGSGTVQLAELAGEGYAGLATAALGKGFATGKEAGEHFAKHIRDISTAITGINLSPANKEQEAMGNLLAILPDGIQSAGETVYEKTGSALAGAGTQALLTLLTLKPGIATKAFGKVRVKEAPISTAFDELAVKNPEGAEALTEHVGQVDKKTAQYMKNRIQKFKDASEEELGKIGKAAAKANLESLEPPPMKEIIKSGTVRKAAEPPAKPEFKQVGTTPEGKPRVRAVTQEQLSSGLRSTVREAHEAFAELKPELKLKSEKGVAEPDIVYFSSGVPVTRASVEAAFRIGKEQLEKVPGALIVKGKLAQYAEGIIKNINPEALGIEAKRAAATIAKAMAEQIQSDSSHYTKSQPRRTFWIQRSDAVRGFMEGAERGKKFKDPLLEQTREAYKDWNAQMAAQDRAAGFTYEEADHYMAHIFEDGKGAVKYLQRKFGTKWGDPGFIKDRTFDLYEEARKAGFTPKFDNPEDIMLARQHASDMAGMKVQVLRDLESQGLAVKVDPKGGGPVDFPSTQRRSPNGDLYWVHNNAEAVVKNAFDSQSMWNMEGLVGDAFRGTMALKNRIVPLKLAISLFHPIHVATIDNATGMVRATKEMLAGEKHPLVAFKDILNAARYKGFIDNPREGGRLLKMWQGKLDDNLLTLADRQSLQYMFEGGLIPEMSAQYRTHAMQNFKDALAKHSLTTPIHLFDVILGSLQRVMFEKWIPSLKIASYLKDVQTALKVNPELVSRPFDRQLAFRKLAKSVDNRYGEMAYSTLFWNKWVKDLAVANTLSLGWQMGFIREYGGGAMDIGQALMKPGELAGKAKQGLLDRPLFLTFYTTQAFLYGGLLTYALTGKTPQDLLDYIYPRTGGEGPDGKPARATTMFYPREFMAISKHIENEGVVAGLSKTVEAKASGMVGMARDWATGVNSFRQDIRDPTHSAFKQIEETLAYSLGDLEPISLQAMQKDQSNNPVKAAALAVTGFGPAPKYITETPVEAHIKTSYDKYVRPKETSYDRFVYSKDIKGLQQAYSKDDPKYDKMLDAAQEKYDLKAEDIRRLERQFRREDAFDLSTYMFSRLEWTEQKHLLDKMSAAEREKYLPRSNKKHLRNNYEPPEGSK